MAALTDAASPDQRRAAIALNRLAINLGMSVGPAVGGFLALVSFPLLFVVDGLTSLAAAAVLTALLWARDRGRPTMGEHFAPRAMATGGAMVWRDRAAMRLLATSLLVAVVFIQMEGAMPLYVVRDLHFRESFFGALFVINTLIIIAVEVPLNLAMSHWHTRSAIALGAVLIGVGFGGLAVAHSALPIVATVVIWTFGEMIFFPTSTAYVADLAPAGRTGEYMGAFSSTFSLALIVGPWAGVSLLDRFGGAVTWSAMLACALGAAALFGMSKARDASRFRVDSSAERQVG
jgi:MFS family permease